MENTFPCSPHAPGAQPPQNQPGRLVQQAWPRGTADSASPVLPREAAPPVRCPPLGPSGLARSGAPRRTRLRAGALVHAALLPLVHQDHAAACTRERQQQATVTARAASCSSAATGRGGGESARPHVRPRHPPSGAQRSRGWGAACFPARRPSSVRLLPSRHSKWRSFSWPLNSGPCRALER